MAREWCTVLLEKCSLLLCGKEFVKRKGDSYCLLIEVAAVAGKGEGFVFKCICFGVRWLSVSLPLWVSVAKE